MTEESLRRWDDSGRHRPVAAGVGRRLAVALLGVLICLAGSPMALAAIYTWKGATSGAWETATNWQGSSVPSTGVDLLQFNDASRYSITSATAVSGISVARFTTTSSNYSISGSGSWTFNDSGALISSTNTNTVALNIVGGSDLTLQTSDGANLIVGNTGNTLAMPATGTSNILTVNAGSSSTITIYSVVSGAASLTKSGSGTLNLSGTNTYTGDTSIEAGTLVAGAAGALSSTTDVSITSGATLSCIADQSVASLSGQGAVSLSDATLTVNTDSGTSTTYSGPLSGSGTASLIKSGAGSQTLAGTVSNTGVTVNAGTLTFSGSSAKSITSLSGSGNVTLSNATLTVTNSSDCTFTGAMSVASGTAGTLAKSGSGTLTLSGTLSGVGVNATQGTLVLDGTGAKSISSLAGSGDVTLSNTATLTVTNSSDNTFSGDLAGSGAGNTLAKEGDGMLTLGGTVSNVAATVNDGTLAFTGSLSNVDATVNSGGTLAFGGSGTSTLASLSGSGTVNATTSVTIQNTSNSEFSGTWNGNDQSLTKSGSSTQTFSGTVNGLRLIMDEGTVVFSGSDAKTLTSLSGDGGTVTLSDATLTVTNSSDCTFSGTMNAATGMTGTLAKSGSGTLTLSGTLSGIGVNAGEGTLLFTGDQTITSLTGSGNVTLTGATLTVDNSSNSTFSGNMSAASGTSGTLTKSGEGTFTLTGTYTDTNLTVDAGILKFNGTQSGGTTTVNSNGLLQGIGTLANLVNYGTVSPGNSIGTLMVTGNYTHAAGSTLTIEINDAGQSDVIHATGTATLQGGMVDVRAASGNYTSGQRYTFLRADGGVSGTFDSVIEDLAFLDASLVYGSNTVQLELISSRDFVDAANTFNQRGVASYLDRQKNAATGDFATVIDQLNLLSESEARLAFDAMSGELFGSLATVTLENSERFLEGVAQRLRSQSLARGFNFSSSHGDPLEESVQEICCHSSRLRNLSGWNPWFEGFGASAGLAGDGNASGLEYSVGGLTVGLERSLDDDLFVGLVGGYGNTYTALETRSDRGTIDQGTFGVYLQRDVETHYQTALATFGYSAYDTTRHVSFGSIDRSAMASFNGNNFSFYTETGRNFRGRFVHLQPYAALEYIQVQQDGFVESHADSLDLSVNGINADAFRGLVGSRLMSYLRTGSGRLVSLEGRAAWRHEFLSQTRILDAVLVGQSGTPFAVAGVNVDRDAAILGCGLSTNLTQAWKFCTNYDLLFSENYAVHAASASLQCCW